MKALTLQGKLEISYETVRDPAIVDSGDVIIKVDQCAICGSDLHIYHDREKGCDHGTIMGHERVRGDPGDEQGQEHGGGRDRELAQEIA